MRDRYLILSTYSRSNTHAHDFHVHATIPTSRSHEHEHVHANDHPTSAHTGFPSRDSSSAIQASRDGLSSATETVFPKVLGDDDNDEKAFTALEMSFSESPTRAKDNIFLRAARSPAIFPRTIHKPSERLQLPPFAKQPESDTDADYAPQPLRRSH